MVISVWVDGSDDLNGCEKIDLGSGSLCVFGSGSNNHIVLMVICFLNGEISYNEFIS